MPGVPHYPLEWNVIGLPSSVSDGTDTARRVYAADGTLLAVYSGTTGTEGRVRIGNFDILSSSSGALTLESAAWEGGRLLPGTGNDKILYHITDHLGSVRVVKDGTGAVLQRFDYYPFGSISGSWSSSANPSQPSLRYRFSGKEIAGQIIDASLVASALAGTPAAAAGTPYLDFGARLYNPRSAAWLSQDPLAEKYYGISPYAYCAGNPVNLVDPEGMEGVKTIDENGNVTITSNVVVLLEKQHAIPEDASDSRAKKINSNNERIAKRNQALLEMVEGFLSVEFSNATTSDGRKVSFDFNIIPVEVSDPTRTTFSEARVIALENGIKGVDTGRRPGEFGYDVALAAVIGQGSSGGHLGLTTGKVLITANDFSARTIAHEIGHTFKLEDNTTGFYGGLMDAPANPLSSYNVETIIKNAYVKK